MADSVVTLRPNGTMVAGSFAAVGAGSLHAATNDNSDSTYANPSGLGPMKLLMDDPAIPALAVIHSVRVRVRAGGGFAQQGVAWIEDLSGRSISLGSYGGAGSIQTFTLNTATSTPDGTPWTPASVTNILVGLQNNGGAPVYEVYLDVFYNQAPTVTVSAPTGTINLDGNPATVLAYSDPESDAQERYWRKTFQQSIYTSGGFDPETAAAVGGTDTGEVLSPATTVAGGATRVNGTYRDYVKVADAGSHGRYSAWAYSEYTLSIDSPDTPTITATADLANARVSLALETFDNFLSTDAADFEGGLGEWVADVNSTIVQDTTHADHGTKSMRVTSIAAGAASARVPNAAGDGYTVVAGTTYTARERAGMISGNRSAHISVRWFNAAGTVQVGQSDGSTVTISAAGFALLSVTATAPAGAALAQVIVVYTATGAGDQMLVDSTCFKRGTSTAWTRGGLSGTHTVTIERSDDAGTTWSALKRPYVLYAIGINADGSVNPAPEQIATVADYEAPPGVAVQYRAKTNGSEGSNSLVSPYSTTTTATLVIVGSWLKDPLDPTRNIPVTIEGTQLDTDTTEPQAPHWALNRADPIITAGVVRLDSIPQLTFFFPDDATWKAFKTLRESGRVLLLQTCYGDSGNEQWYLRLGQTARTSRLTVDTMRTAQPRRVTIDAQAVEAPA